MPSDPNLPGWKFLRTFGAGGVFDDDDDWSGTAADLPLDLSASIPRYVVAVNTPVTGLEYFVAAMTEDGELVEPSGSVDVAPVQWVRRPSDDPTPSPGGGITIAGDTVSGLALQSPRNCRLHGECERFSLRMTGAASLPATADHLRVYYRETGG